MGSTYKLHGASVNLRANSFAKTGYHFDGWNTVAGGSGTDYADQAPYSVNASDTLYAQWEAKTYTVTLDANGGTLGNKTQVTATFDKPFENILSTSLPTHTGYKFAGFFDSKTEGLQYFNADGTATSRTWTKDSGGTLYAHWTIEQYNIIYVF